MCLTKNLKYMVCFHVNKHKKQCKYKPGSFLGRFNTCIQRVETISEYSLCHECRRTWAKHGIGEDEAIRSYQNYRSAHDYDGPLSPYYIILSEEETAVPKEDNNSIAGKSNQAVQNLVGSASSGSDTMDVPAELQHNGATKRRAPARPARTPWTSIYSAERTPTTDDKSERSGLQPPNNKGVLFLTEDEGAPPQWI